ncbi:MAG: hypothetical protein WCK54_18835 [Desulfuromonadales bacterium]
MSNTPATLPPGEESLIKERSVSWVRSSGVQGLRARIARESGLKGTQLDEANLIALSSALDRMTVDRAELESANAAWKAAMNKLNEYVSALQALKSSLLAGNQAVTLAKVPHTCAAGTPAATHFFGISYSMPGACVPTLVQSAGKTEVIAEIKWVIQRMDEIRTKEDNIKDRLEEAERQYRAIMEALSRAAAAYQEIQKSILLP